MSPQASFRMPSLENSRVYFNNGLAIWRCSVHILRLLCTETRLDKTVCTSKIHSKTIYSGNFYICANRRSICWYTCDIALLWTTLNVPRVVDGCWNCWLHQLKCQWWTDCKGFVLWNVSRFLLSFFRDDVSAWSCTFSFLRNSLLPI